MRITFLSEFGTRNSYAGTVNGIIKSICFKNFESNQFYGYYSLVTKGNPLFLWNSLGFLELAVNQSNAAQYFNYNNKDKITFYFK